MSVVDRNLQPRVNCLQSFKRSFCEKISDQSDPGGWSVVTRTIVTPGDCPSHVMLAPDGGRPKCIPSE